MAGRNTSGAAGTGEQVKIASIVRQVPDAEARIRAEGGSVSLEGVSFILDGMDEYGTEEALRLREGGLDAEIIVFAAGPARTEEAVRTALAMGADRAVFVETDEPLDVLAQAQLLAGLIKDEQIDLVLVGGKQADWDSAGLGAALADALGWPLSDWTTSLELNGSSLRTRHASDPGRGARERDGAGAGGAGTVGVLIHPERAGGELRTGGPELVTVALQVGGEVSALNTGADAAGPAHEPARCVDRLVHPANVPSDNR